MKTILKYLANQKGLHSAILKNKLLLLLPFLFISSIMCGQKGSLANSIFTEIQSYIIHTESGYDSTGKKVISDLAFKNIITPYYTRAAAGIDGVIKNGRNFTYNVDPDKSTLAINHLFISYNHPFTLINLNINGSSEGNFLNIVKNAKYNYGLEGTLKFSTKIYRSTLFYAKANSDELILDRQRNNTLILSRYKKILKTNRDTLTTKCEKMNRILNTRTMDFNDTLSFQYYQKIIDSLAQLTDSIKQITDLLKSHKNQEIFDEVDAEIATFEANNFKINGYKLHWIDYGASYKLLGNSIFNDTILKANKIAQKNFHRLMGTLSYNFLRNTKWSLFYFSIGINAFNRYALEELKVQNFDFTDTSGVTTSFKGYDVSTGKDINVCTVVMNPFITLLLYPGENKFFGLELAASVINNPKSPNIVDGRFGVVYSLSTKNEDKTVSRSTVGLFITLNKYDVSIPRMDNYYGIGFRVGIPLANLFDEKK
jgi:hypothetical protein